MTKRTLMVLVALISLVGSVYAHHSYSAYQTDQIVSIEGSVVRVEFVNPHVNVMIKTKDGEYSAEFPAMSVLTRANFTAESLKVGDVVVASGSPMRDREIHRMSLMKEIRRPSDGWIWSSVQQSKPSN